MPNLIVVLDRRDYCASLRNLDAVAARPNFKFVKGDVQSGDLLAYVLATEAVDTVLHFAAQVRGGTGGGGVEGGPLERSNATKQIHQPPSSPPSSPPVPRPTSTTHLATPSPSP